MNIVVFIKQVPDTTDVKWTENNNIDRTNMESVINPSDRQALEAALILKDRYGATITVVTMVTIYDVTRASGFLNISLYASNENFLGII